MMKSKHIVQAQRKFAVGAVVPAQPERRVEPAPAALPPPEPGDVRHCGMSAPQLLNAIMMMSIHPHAVSQPVVVLERLHENDNDSHQVKIENTRIPKTPSKVAKKSKSDNQKETPSKQPSCRSLRSQVLNTNGERKRRRSESSVTDVEDNRPLKFFRNQNRDVKNSTIVKAPPKSSSTNLKRVSLRQMKLRQASNNNNKAKQRRRSGKTMITTKITKIIKPKRKGSSRLREVCEMPATSSRVRTRTASHTRARDDGSAAPPLSPGDPAAVATKKSPPDLPVNSSAQFRTPRLRRRVVAPSSPTGLPRACFGIINNESVVADSSSTARPATFDEQNLSESVDTDWSPVAGPATIDEKNLGESVDTDSESEGWPTTFLGQNLSEDVDVASSTFDEQNPSESVDTDWSPVAGPATIDEKNLGESVDTDREAEGWPATFLGQNLSEDVDVAAQQPACVSSPRLSHESDDRSVFAPPSQTPLLDACFSPSSGSRAGRAFSINDSDQNPSDQELVISVLVDRIQDSPSRPPTASPGAASDVYIFNDTEAEAEPSPFRPSRPRQVQRSLSRPPRSQSLDPGLSKRKTRTKDLITIIDFQAKMLSSFVSPDDQTKKVKRVESLVKMLSRYKTKFILDERVEDDHPSTRPIETLLIEDDDVAKQEPDKPLAGNSTEVPLACNSADDNPRATTDLPSAPSLSHLADDDDDGPEIAEAPAFYPTKEEMKDLNSYVEKMQPVARKYGIFKIVPPRDFQPPCQLKNVQFKSTNQYVSSMYSRWGPAASEMTAIKANLATQNVAFTRPPLFEGVEVDLVKLYQLVQEHGGLIRVMEEHKWAAIAEKMQLNARAGRVKADVKLDKIYMKHLLPYETLSEEERRDLRARVTAAWQTRYQRQRARAARPLHRQRRLLGESESSDEDEEPEPPELASAFLEVEDCVVPGSNMNLTRFRRVGERVRDMRFPGASADAPPHWAAVERAYWRLVRNGTEHVCVHGAALDTSQDALGFPAAIDAPYGNHPWNLKRLGESNHNVLSSLGPTLAVTVPTLHLGMMFSTNCWHHDPHHLPWTEYMHQGPPKIWYGIADSESAAFRAAAEQLCPTAVQQKALWLPSDTAMIPPRLLAARGVRLVRALQAPGEYVVVLPRAYSCSISTGLTVSESLYFAGDTWLDGVDKVFAALRADAEPSMFPLEALLEGVVQRPGAPLPRLLRARTLLRPLLQAETSRRRQATALGVLALSPKDFLKKNRRCSKTSWQVVRDECHVCRATLYWSKIIDISSRVSVCLEHGLRLVRSRNASAGVEISADAARAVDGFTTILFYSDHQLTQLITDLDKPLKQT